MQEKHFLGCHPGGLHRIAYTEWGTPDAARTAICVHGLTRNGRDFDDLAQALAGAGWRVVCPDIAGRGKSDRLPSAELYGFPQYLNDMTALIARLDVERVDWIGTSMGGLMGMMFAAPRNTPLRSLVINDIGPYIARSTLLEIGDYVGKNPVFESYEDAEAYIRETHAGFGKLSDAQWKHLTQHSVAKSKDGYRPIYDPQIGEAFHKGYQGDVDLWSVWDAITCPTLVLRGKDSTTLSSQTAAGMSRRGPCAKEEVISGCGHAPALMDEKQIRLIVDFLQQQN
ncbi:MAG: alpha/beta hydrolase [Rhodovibrionaceae bacterium]